MQTIPATPTDGAPISIYLRGTKTDPCSFVGSSALNINNNLISISLNWDNEANYPPFPVCAPAQVPWDTTIVVGTLSVGTYFIVLGGQNFFSTGLPNAIAFDVIDQNCAQPDGSIWVTNTADNGAGSLRQAITCANSSLGANTIKFNLPGSGPDTVRVGATTGAPLPDLTDAATIIDGTTHPGFGNAGDYSPKIVLEGKYTAWSAPIDALRIEGNDCSIFSLEIINFPDDAIDILSANGVTIGGIDKGNVIHDNGYVQDFFPGAPGSGPWEGCGIVFQGNSNNGSVLGNYIGTNYSQTTNTGNEFCGILVRQSGDNNQIGGTAPGEENVIANNAVGVQISSGSFSCGIRRNMIYCNDSIGIDLINSGNIGIASPTITTATPFLISGQSSVNGNVEVYLNDNTNCANAVCQGKTFLGTTTVANGIWTLNSPFANGVTLVGGDLVTATITTFNSNTSEFAVCLPVSGASACTEPNGDIYVFNINDEGSGSLREAIDCANSTLGSNVIKFNIPGGRASYDLCWVNQWESITISKRR